MERAYYLELAAQGLRMPIGTDLVLHEHADHEAIVNDGERLGQVLAEAARRFHTPLALPHMDLGLEKAVLLTQIGLVGEDPDRFHFSAPPGLEAFAAAARPLHAPLPARLRAQVGSVRYIARNTGLLPIGMSIGPFSLMTKLVSDPITPIALAGMGLTAADDEAIATVEAVLQLSLRVILDSIEAQMDAGARAIFVAEPAANKVYLSPHQIDAGADVFDRFVMAHNRQLKARLEERGVDLMFHCCGELTDQMVREFTTLDPALLSLGSSRVLWDDAAMVPKDIVLYGNLPSKRFYSDSAITAEQVGALSEELIWRMAAADHPFILGTECDVLSVPGCEAAIARKIAALVRAECAAVAAG
jgi:uroporphyrinogen-III decarboxylase